MIAQCRTGRGIYVDKRILNNQMVWFLVGRCMVLYYGLFPYL